MTDETSEEEVKKEPQKKLRGFANKNQRKNIRRAGREEGSKNKKTKLSHKEISDLFSSNTPEVFRHGMKLMKSGSEATQRAMVAKFLDHAISLSVQNEKMKLTKTDDNGKTSSYEVEQEGTGTSGKVLKLTFDD